MHSGAGRIVTLRMRPLSLAERALADPSVSLASLLAGDRPDVGGGCETTLDDSITSLLASGFPGMLGLPPRTARAQLDGYLDRIVLRDVEEHGRRVRRPDALRDWRVAYPAATATTASYTALLDAATPGDADKPARRTTETYRAVLRGLWHRRGPGVGVEDRGHVDVDARESLTKNTVTLEEHGRQRRRRDLDAVARRTTAHRTRTGVE